MTEALFVALSAHCFWGTCPHVAVGLTQQEVHDAMEVHYQADHRQDIDALGYPGLR